MKIKDVKKILSVTNRTIHNYVKQGKLRYVKINDKHYNYNDEDVYSILGETKYINRAIVEHRNRLCKFGFDLFQNICKQYNRKIIVASDIKNTTYEQELIDGLISILNDFYGNKLIIDRIKEELLKENDKH